MVNLRTGAEFLLVKSQRHTQSLSSFLTLIKNSVPVLEISKFFIEVLGQEKIAHNLCIQSIKDLEEDSVDIYILK